MGRRGLTRCSVPVVDEMHVEDPALSTHASGVLTLSAVAAGGRCESERTRTDAPSLAEPLRVLAARRLGYGRVRTSRNTEIRHAPARPDGCNHRLPTKRSPNFCRIGSTESLCGTTLRVCTLGTSFVVISSPAGVESPDATVSHTRHGAALLDCYLSIARDEPSRGRALRRRRKEGKSVILRVLECTRADGHSVLAASSRPFIDTA